MNHYQKSIKGHSNLVNGFEGGPNPEPCISRRLPFVLVIWDCQVLHVRPLYVDLLEENPVPYRGHRCSFLYCLIVLNLILVVIWCTIVLGSLLSGSCCGVIVKLVYVVHLVFEQSGRTVHETIGELHNHREGQDSV